MNHPEPEYSYPSPNSYIDVGTLGDPNNPATCSQIVLEELDKTKTPVLYPTFEEAAGDVLKRELSTFMVPAAYPLVSNFIQNQSLSTVEVVIYPIPPLVVCSEKNMTDNARLTCFYHPATKSLLSKVKRQYPNTVLKYVLVSSNVEACIEHQRNSMSSIAVTNQACSDLFKLPVRLILNNQIKMPWLFMQRTNEALQ